MSSRQLLRSVVKGANRRPQAPFRAVVFRYYSIKETAAHVASVASAVKENIITRVTKEKIEVKTEPPKQTEAGSTKDEKQESSTTVHKREEVVIDSSDKKSENNNNNQSNNSSQNNSEEHQRKKRRDKFISTLLAGALVSISYAVWAYFQDKVFVQKIVSQVQIVLTMKPGAYKLASELPVLFIDDVLKTKETQRLNDILNYPLLGDAGSPHILVLLGLKGTGKSTAIRELLNREEAIIYVDLSTIGSAEKLPEQLYSAVSVVGSEGMKQDAFRSAVSKEVKKQYHKVLQDGPHGTQLPYKIILDSADTMFKFNSTHVISWLIWLMDLSNFANVVFVCSDVTSIDQLKAMNQVQNRYDVQKIGALANKDIMRKYINRRIESIKGHKVTLGELDVETVIESFGGIFTDYEKMFLVNKKGQTVREKYDLIIEQTKHELVDLLSKYDSADAANVVTFLGKLAKQQRLPHSEAANTLKKMFHALEREQIIMFEGEKYVSVVPRIIYAYKLLKKEGML